MFLIKTLDPVISTGFLYKTEAGNPLFTSIILPGIGGGNNSYKIETLGASGWQFAGYATPLTEFFFGSPVSEFEVLGIDTSGLNPNLQWVSAVGFESAGSFTGTIEALGSVAAVPEPTSVILMICGLMGLVLRLRWPFHARRHMVGFTERPK